MERSAGGGDGAWTGLAMFPVQLSVPSTLLRRCARSKEQNGSAPQRFTDGPKGLEPDTGIEFGLGIEFRS